MCSISFHEEIPQRMGRAFSEADAAMLLDEAKALGVNMIRLAHYPQKNTRFGWPKKWVLSSGKKYLFGKELILLIIILARKLKGC